MLVAVAVVSLRYHAFAMWLAWLAFAAAGAQSVLWVSTVVDTGPLAVDGWLSFALYPFFLSWLLPATIVMIRGAGKPSGELAHDRRRRRGRTSGAATVTPLGPAGRDLWPDRSGLGRAGM